MVQHGRRAESRLRVRLPARLITHHGEWAVVLVDLSQNGASVQCAHLDTHRGEAVLQWCGFEAFGAIRWCRSGYGGLAFFDPIPARWLIATRDHDDAERLPGERELARRVAHEWATGQRRV